MKSQSFQQCRFLSLSLALLQAACFGTVNLMAAEHNAGPSWELDIENGTIEHGGARSNATLGLVINLLGDKYPANVAMAPGVANVRIEDLKLSTFRWEQALDALRVASGNAFRWEKSRANDGTDSLEDLFTLTPDLSSGFAGGRAVEVFNLGSYLKGQDDASVEKALLEIQNIIVETMAMLSGPGRAQSENPGVKFHPTAKLLVIVGEPQALAAARSVLLALPGVTGSQAPSSYAGGGSIDPTTGAPTPSTGIPPQVLERYGLARPAVPEPPAPGAGFGGGAGRYGGGSGGFGGGAPTKPTPPPKPGVAPSPQQRY